MNQVKTNKGFTLVELAIVMTIIGLLIGGILKGQELMNNARVTATIAQVRSYEAAMTTFQDTYQALPGDMPNAAARIAGARTGPTGTTLGDSRIGSGAPEAHQSATTTEPTIFWQHMALTNLISGVVPTSATVAWGESHPAARIGGGFHAKSSDGAAASPWIGTRPQGNVFVLQQTVNTDLGNTAGVQVLSPLRAAQIDRRMDDGQPSTGFVRAYGVTASCGTGTPVAYVETITTQDCGLSFAAGN